jgi:hypothetical protein
MHFQLIPNTSQLSAQLERVYGQKKKGHVRDPLSNLHDDDIDPCQMMMAGRRPPRQKSLGRYAGVSRVVVLDDDDDDRQ